MEKRHKREKIICNIIAIFILILFLFPIYWMVITSLKSDSEIFAAVPTFFRRKLHWKVMFHSCL